MVVLLSTPSSRSFLMTVSRSRGSCSLMTVVRSRSRSLSLSRWPSPTVTPAPTGPARPGENGCCCLAFRRNLRKQKAEDHGVVFRAQEPNHQCRGRATSSGFTLTCRPLCFLGGALGLGFALAGNRHQHFALARCRLLGLTPLGR